MMDVNYSIFLAFLESSLSKKFYKSEVCKKKADGKTECFPINVSEHPKNDDAWSRCSKNMYEVSKEYLTGDVKLPQLIIEHMEKKLVEEQVLTDKINFKYVWGIRQYEPVYKEYALEITYVNDMFIFIDSNNDKHYLDTRQFVGHAYRSLLAMHRMCVELGELNVSKR